MRDSLKPIELPLKMGRNCGTLDRQQRLVIPVICCLTSVVRTCKHCFAVHNAEFVVQVTPIGNSGTPTVVSDFLQGRLSGSNHL